MSNLMNMTTREITEKIRNAELTISIFGLGWMGLSTACLFAEVGAKVIGVDVNERTVEILRRGQSHLDEPGLTSIITKHIGKNLSVTTDTQQATDQSDIILIVVPTTIDNMRKPDYSSIELSCRKVGLAMKRNCMVIVESTVGPSITEIGVKEVLEANSGFKAGVDFGLAYSPIRAMAGRAMKDIQTYPKIVGGIDERSFEIASTILASIAKGGIIKVRDLKTAETVKLFENVYRDVNIALASELAIFCEKAGLDFTEVREATLTQPHCHLHIPRVGVGGHCIPFNPYFLITEATALGVDLKLVRYARRVNDNMPSHIVHLVTKGLKDCEKGLNGSKIAVLGIAYRNDVKEANNSPSIKIIEMLQKKGMRVQVYDPFFSTLEIKKMGFKAMESVEKAIEGVDCILVATGHEQLKRLKMAEISRLVRKPACLVDGWRIFNAEDAKQNNLIYYGVGLG